MKKKYLAALMAAAMTLGMATTSLAASITVTNAQKNETYDVYKIFDVTNSDDNYAYSIEKGSQWEDLVDAYTYNGVDVFTLTPSATNPNKLVVTVDESFTGASAGADFAAYLAANLEGKKADATETPDADKAITFKDLADGYYFVDTSLGTLCALDTSATEVEVTDKNPDATIEKKVEEDSTGAWGDDNTAQIGQTVNFKTTITAYQGAENYVLHDEMEAGLTLLPKTIAVEGLTKGEDYTVITSDLPTTCGISEGCDFHIVFDQDYLDTITAETKIVVTYSAILNDDAEISDDTNDNNTKLTYGDSSYTEWDKTETKTFSFDIIKTDSDKELLEGAEFELYDAATGGNKIALVKDGEVYRIATEGEESKVETIKAGKVTVVGLDANTNYYLEETVAPDGYNMLTERVLVAMGNNNLSTSMEGNTWVDGNGGVQITNNAGAELPSTGGIGTTIFYVLGGLLAAFSGVLLFTKKRMNNEF